VGESRQKSGLTREKTSPRKRRNGGKKGKEGAGQGEKDLKKEGPGTTWKRSPGGRKGKERFWGLFKRNETAKKGSAKEEKKGPGVFAEEPEPSPRHRSRGRKGRAKKGSSRGAQNQGCPLGRKFSALGHGSEGGGEGDEDSGERVSKRNV